MAIFLGIDVGKVRVGCAYVDDTVGIPFPIGIWQRAAGEAESKILQTINERKPAKIIAGLPLGPAGERTEICSSIEAFMRRIARRIAVEVEYIDESFSSLDAMERVHQKVSEPRKAIDDVAACLILERYLEASKGR